MAALPAELICAVLDEACDTSDADDSAPPWVYYAAVRDLRSCSLVCRSWKPHAQARLFREIIFYRGGGHRIKLFRALLDRSAHIARYVRKLDVSLPRGSRDLTDLLIRLPKLVNLHELKIVFDGSLCREHLRELAQTAIFKASSRLRSVYLGEICFGSDGDYRWMSLVLQHLTACSDQLEALSISCRIPQMKALQSLTTFQWGDIASPVRVIVCRNRPPATFFDVVYCFTRNTGLEERVERLIRGELQIKSRLQVRARD